MAEETPGTTFDFQAVSGEVVGTDQRSDSYTTGSSRTLVIDGSGAGSGHVRTDVIITRDIWIRDPRNYEHHFRIQADVPVRVGQEISFLRLVARNYVSGQSFDGLTTIYAVASDTYWSLAPLPGIVDRLVSTKWTPPLVLRYGANWVFGIALCPFYVGIPIVLFLLVQAVRNLDRRRRTKVGLLAGLENEHRSTIRRVHLAHSARQAAIARERPASQAAIGSVT